MEYARALHTLVMWLGICDGNMQEGSFRCDANVSVRKPGGPLGTRREIKNLNSFRFMQQAIDFEVNWQIDRLEDGLSIEQATVLFDPDNGETRAMRSKEDAQDYRYFPDPDLPPLVITPRWIEQIRATMPELPGAMAERFVQSYGLSPQDATQMTQSLAMARFFESAATDSGQPKLVANWMMGEVSRRLSDGSGIEHSPVSPEAARIVTKLAAGDIHSNRPKNFFDDSAPGTRTTRRDRPLWLTGSDVVLRTGKLGQMSDSSGFGVGGQPKSIDEYRAGKDKAFNAQSVR